MQRVKNEELFMSLLNIKLIRTEDLLDTTFLYVGKDKMMEEKGVGGSLLSYLLPALALLALLH